MRSFVVIGLGRFGTAVAKELMSSRCEVLAIDFREEVVQQISEMVTHAVVADARDEGIMRRLDVGSYDCAVVCVGGDVASSILVTMLLKELGVKEIVCKAGSDAHKKALQKVGADWALMPEKEMAIRVAQSLANTKVFDSIQLSDEYAIVERSVPKSWIDKQLRELSIQEKNQVSIVAVHRGKRMLINPKSETRLLESDHLVMMGRQTDLTRLEKL